MCEINIIFWLQLPRDNIHMTGRGLRRCRSRGYLSDHPAPRTNHGVGRAYGGGASQKDDCHRTIHYSRPRMHSSLHIKIPPFSDLCLLFEDWLVFEVVFLSEWVGVGDGNGVHSSALLDWSRSL